MEIESIIKTLETRIESKRKERENQLDFVETRTQQHSDTLCSYEQNTIGDLAVMLQLSAEIRELEFVLSLLRACCTSKPTV